ncbi:MAG: hypothetical protein ABI569_10335 [Casimicrobiaceae bacterium]
MPLVQHRCHRACRHSPLARQRGNVAARIVACFVAAVGVGLLTGPWWSSTLPASDRPLVIVLGAIFAGIGAYGAIPDSLPRARTLAFVLFLGAFGLACAAIALAQVQPDGTTIIAGVGRIAASEPMPVWARLVAGLFALLLLGSCGLALWGLVRGMIAGTSPNA